MSQVVTEPLHTGGFLLSMDGEHNLSRDKGTVKSGSGVLVPGQVMAEVPIATGDAVAVSQTGTGNGVLTIDATTPLLPGAKVGKYKATCIAAATNSGTFRVADPDGRVLGDVDVGATFADQVKFAIADGSTDFVVGDAIIVNVKSFASVFVPYDETGADGSQFASAILWQGLDATSSAVVATFVTRHAEVIDSMLRYKSGATSNGKATAIAQLKAKSIVSRA